MIVHCPSCGTRYRHRPAPGETPVSARCSSCEHVFPIASQARSYVVVDSAGRDAAAHGTRVPPVAARAARGSRLSIGMDDPSIAARIERTAFDEGAAGAAALTYRVDVDERQEKGGKAAAAAPADPAHDEPRRAGLGALVAALATAAAGAWAGWYFSPHLVGQPETWILAGAGVGLVVAWAGLRWTQKRF